MIFSIVILLILIVINGIFSASELAFLSLDKVFLKQEVKKQNKKAIMINKVLENPSKFLSTIQICITLAGFLASALAADYFADYFLKMIDVSILPLNILRSILVILITIILSYFTLVFGELVPKKIAINNPYKVASLFVRLVVIMQLVFYPLVKILTITTEIICKIFKIKDKEESITEEDIKRMILLGNDEGIIEEKEKEYILNVFDFNDREVSQVMTPKKDVVLLNIDDDLKDNILKIKQSKYTRYPVYKKDINNIIGILNVKDFIMQNKDKEKLELKNIIRPVKKFLYYEKIDDVFRNMQEENESIGIIYKNDDFIGIVTIEDAIEEIVGNIYDEYEKNY